MENSAIALSRIIARNLCLRLDVSADTYATFKRDSFTWVIKIVVTDDKNMEEGIAKVQTLLKEFVAAPRVENNVYTAYMGEFRANEFQKEFGYV